MLEIKATRNIQYKYIVMTELGSPFSDAIYFSEDAPWDQKQIDAEIATRVANHVDAIQNPPAEVILTDEEKLALAEAELAQLDQQIEYIESRKLEVTEMKSVAMESIAVAVEEKKKIIDDPVEEVPADVRVR